MRLLILICVTITLLLTVGCSNPGKQSIIEIEVATPELIEQLSSKRHSSIFKEIQAEALKRHKAKNSNYAAFFFKVREERYPSVRLIKLFGTEKAIDHLTRSASNNETETYVLNQLESQYERIRHMLQLRLTSKGISVMDSYTKLTKNKIILTVPEISEFDKNEVRELISSSASLQFVKTYSLADTKGFLTSFYEQKVTPQIDESTMSDTSNTEMSLTEELILEENKQKKIDSIKDNALNFILNINSSTRNLHTPQLAFAPTSDTGEIMDALHIFKKEEMQDHLDFAWGANHVQFRGVDDRFFVLYALNTIASQEYGINSNQITSSKITVDENTGSIEIHVTFNSVGTEELKNITTKNINQFMAIVVNNKVVCSPIINNPISGGELVITGGFTSDEAKKLSSLLKVGGLPASCTLLSIERK